MLVSKSQLFIGILATCGIATNAKSSVPSSRRVFRAGGHTSRRTAAKKSPKDLTRTCSAINTDGNNEKLVFQCASEADTLWYSLDSTNNAKIDLVVKKGKKGKKKDGKGPSKGGKNSLGVSFLRLVEYVPNATSPAYDFKVEALKTYPLDTFGKFTDVTNTSGVYETSLQTKDKVVTFKYHITEDGSNTGKGSSPHKIKYDIIIEGFGWKQAEGSLLALVAEVDTPSGKSKAKKKPIKGTGKYELEELDSELEVDEAEDGSGSAGEGYSIFGEYSWVSDAESKNGTKLSIVATQPVDQKEDAKKRLIAFSFLGSSGEEKITWDPEVGVGYTSTSGASSLVSFASAKQLMVGAFLSLAYFW